MIYLLYGTDTDKARAKLHELVASLLKKKPDASHIKLTDETFSDAALEENISGMGLFSQKTIVEMDSVFRNPEAKESVIDRLKDIGASENIFVFLEGKLNKAELTKFEKNAEKIQEFSLPAEAASAKVGAFNMFSLTDALGKRDKKQLWVLYQKALQNNSVAEEVHPILFWQIKAMLLADKAASAAEAGLNPFVYQKSKGFLRNFNREEVEQLSSKLVSIYHNARRGINDFESSLEQFILEI